MPVTGVVTDIDGRTLTFVAHFAAPVERVWQVYADPRQLEQVFGPPSHPATFVEHDLRPGGRAHYFMTSPDGRRYFGWWQVLTVDEPRSLSFDDGFATDERFEPSPGMPVSRNVDAFEAEDGGTRATFTSSYESEAGLRTVLDMGVVEGATSAIDQIDGLLASASPA